PKTAPASSAGQNLPVSRRQRMNAAQAEAGGARISGGWGHRPPPAVAVTGHMSRDTVGVVVTQARLTPPGAQIWCEYSGLSPWVMRSEERRVGKECRSRWSA